MYKVSETVLPIYINGQCPIIKTCSGVTLNLSSKDSNYQNWCINYVKYPACKMEIRTEHSYTSQYNIISVPILHNPAYLAICMLFCRLLIFFSPKSALLKNSIRDHESVKPF